MRERKKEKTVSAIVPVFNEEKTVEKVVEALLQCDLIDEVICINDGSTDKSLEILKSFGNRIKLINLKKNHGKGFALASGIKQAKGEIVAFFDSDLPNLSLEHIATLLGPILRNETSVVLGVPKTRKDDYIGPWSIYFAGERAYPREKLLPCLERMAKTRYGVEVYLNGLFDKKETKVVFLDGLILPSKQEKRSPAQAFREHLIEIVEIAQELGKREGLLPEDLDYQKIVNLAKAKTYKDLKAKVGEIKNKKVKAFLSKYVIRYIELAKGKISYFIP